jgi:hypothetical protein
LEGTQATAAQDDQICVAFCGDANNFRRRMAGLLTENAGYTAFA